jgi:hypothetical protein
MAAMTPLAPNALTVFGAFSWNLTGKSRLVALSESVLLGPKSIFCTMTQDLPGMGFKTQELSVESFTSLVFLDRETASLSWLCRL